MWKPVANIVFNSFMIVILGVALYFSRNWPRETHLFPQAIGIPVLALAIISLGCEIYRMRWKPSPLDESSEETGEEDTTDPAFLAKAGIMFAWLVGFGVAIWVFGFYLAALAFLFLYIRLRADITTVGSLLWSVSTAALVALIFELLLGIELYRGLLWTLLS